MRLFEESRQTAQYNLAKSMGPSYLRPSIAGMSKKRARKYQSYYEGGDRDCLHCGQPFTPRRATHVYCTGKHRLAAAQRRAYLKKLKKLREADGVY